MKKLTTNDPETRSADIMSDHVEHLKALFPEAFTEGKIDFDVLKQLLDGTLDERDEKYGLSWHGKRQARRLALTPSTGTLRPAPDESVDWTSTQNLLIEGDNLEVLKLLQKSYAGKVKLIYIDPPYNTGKDFVYPDNFTDSIRNYLELTGQIEGGAKISSSVESGGRFHTAWLNMMLPRLRLARHLLSDDGVIFVTISDHEVHNLRALMNEVFGEENFVATVIWQKVFAPKNTARHFSEDHDYVIVFARNAETWSPQLLPRTEEMEARYNNPDNDPRGPWASDNLTARNYYGAGVYAVTCPSGRVISGPPPGTYWRLSKARFEEFDRDNRIWWGADGDNMPRLKRFLSEVKAGKVPQTLWLHTDVGNTQEAKKELLAALQAADVERVFDTPKPTRLVQRMLQLGTTAHGADLILDFFAGSGSTMCAVWQQNIADGGNRRCILVQLPEPMAQAAGQPFATIAELTKERVRRAGEAIRSAAPMENADVGFRVFKLASSNIREWMPSREDLPTTLEQAVEHLRQDRTEADILYELLLKLGLDLCVPIEERALTGRTVYSIGGGTLLVCLAEQITADAVEPLGLGIVEWHKTLAPAGDTTCVFRDSAFADDVTKTNLAAILQQHGLQTVRSL